MSDLIPEISSLSPFAWVHAHSLVDLDACPVPDLFHAMSLLPAGISIAFSAKILRIKHTYFPCGYGSGDADVSDLSQKLHYVQADFPHIEIQAVLKTLSWNIHSSALQDLWGMFIELLINISSCAVKNGAAFDLCEFEINVHSDIIELKRSQSVLWARATQPACTDFERALSAAPPTDWYVKPTTAHTQARLARTQCVLLEYFSTPRSFLDNILREVRVFRTLDTVCIAARVPGHPTFTIVPVAVIAAPLLTSTPLLS